MNIRLLLIGLLDIFFPNGKPGDRWRGKLMEPLLNSCGKNLCIKKGVFFVSPDNVSIGDNVYIGNYANFGAGKITLDDEVIIGPMTSINAQNHTARNGSYRFGKPIESSIVIKKGSWIGVNSCILPGVTIGVGVLIGANVVVRRNVKDHTIVANANKTKSFKVSLEN